MRRGKGISTNPKDNRPGHKSKHQSEIPRDTQPKIAAPTQNVVAQSQEIDIPSETSDARDAFQKMVGIQILLRELSTSVPEHGRTVVDYVKSASELVETMTKNSGEQGFSESFLVFYQFFQEVFDEWSDPALGVDFGEYKAKFDLLKQG